MYNNNIININIIISIIISIISIIISIEIMSIIISIITSIIIRSTKERSIVEISDNQRRKVMQVLACPR